MRYLAIDHGTRRTGLAICDAGETIVSPVAVLDNPKDLIERIAKLARSEGAGAIVVGLPFNMDGSEGGQAKLVRQFAERLKKAVEIPVYFQDERLSSFSAAERIAPADYTRKKQKKRLDAIAAAEILQAFLDSQTQDQ
jgi:putative Holliday junction resolvase